jgi:hypothetical protein
LSDAITKNDVSARQYILYMGKVLLIGISIIFGIPAILLVVLADESPWGIAFVYAFFGGGGLVFISLQAIIGVRAVREQLPRVISVESNLFKISSGDEREEVSLLDCEWSVGSTQYDPICWFTEFRHGTTIELPGGFVACGFNPESFEIWRAFLTLARVPFRKRMHWIQVAILGIFSVVVGGFLGWSVGVIAAKLMQNPDWQVYGTILGIIEIPAVVYLFFNSGSAGAKATRYRIQPLQVAFAFFAVGFIAGSPGGWALRVVVGIVNGLLGLLVGLLFRRRAAGAESDY